MKVTPADLLRPWTTPLEPAKLLSTLLAGPGTRIEADPEPASTTGIDPARRPETPTIHWGETTVVVADSDETVLHAAERVGLEPMFGCRRGVCRRCVTPLIAGTVRDERDGRDIAAGTHVRVCVSRPLSDIAVEPTSRRAPTTVGSSR